MRIFIAILLSNDIKSYLKSMSDSLDPFFEKARFTHMENYHITIKFIGETDRQGFNNAVKAVKNTAVGSRIFSLRTSQPGSFKRKNKHIYYCGTNMPDALIKLHRTLSEELKRTGIDIKENKLVPHITLAREVVLSDSSPNIAFEEKEIPVCSICVMESTRIQGKLTYIPRFTARLNGGQND